MKNRKFSEAVEKVWQKIEACAGEDFYQIRGKPFSYEVDRDYLNLDRTNQKISKKQIAEALDLVPLKNTVPVQHLRAPSYIYAILNDKRIKGDDW